jgi:hypothetical protein
MSGGASRRRFMNNAGSWQVGCFRRTPVARLGALEKRASKRRLGILDGQMVIPGETAYSCTIGNLDPAREYTVTVTAINAAGESTAVAAAAARPLPVIPVPTLGTWALFSLMLLMFAMALATLGRPERISRRVR